MTNEMYDLLTDLRRVIVEHNVSIYSTTSDDGIYIQQGKERINIGYPFEGGCGDLIKIIENYQKNL